MGSVINTFYLVNSRVLTYQCTNPILHLYPLLQFSALACPSYDPSDRMADQPFTFPFFLLPGLLRSDTVFAREIRAAGRKLACPA